MVKRNLFTTYHILKGFEVILRKADYFFFDIPNLWEYLAQIIAPIFEEGIVNLGFLGDLSRAMVPYLAPCFVAAILKELVISLVRFITSSYFHLFKNRFDLILQSTGWSCWSGAFMDQFKYLIEQYPSGSR